MNETSLKNQNLIIAVILIVGVFFLLKAGFRTFGPGRAPVIDGEAYQAVFFENGQEYFGHLKNIGTEYPYLTDIYYVQSRPSNENPTERKNTLVKLGGELHGPEDVMYFNWDKIVFWENLKSDSEVVRGIAKAKIQRDQKPAVSTCPSPASLETPAQK